LGSKQLDLRQEQREKRARETWVDQRYEKRQGILFCFLGFLGWENVATCLALDLRPQ
jgi:hypothetical protein